MELEVGADDSVKREEESLGLSTPLSKEAEQQGKVVRSEETAKVEEESLDPSTPPGKEVKQQEEVEKVVRSEVPAKEGKESVGPSTPTHLNEDSRAAVNKRKEAHKSKLPVWQHNLVRRSSAFN